MHEYIYLSLKDKLHLSVMRYDTWYHYISWH